jgi:hypothetical protein
MITGLPGTSLTEEAVGMLNDAAVTPQPRDGQADEASAGQPGLGRTPDTLIRTVAGHITAWSPGMQRRYGFTSEQACGHTSHRLLETTFPQPLQAIEAMFVERQTWTGALIHRHADGRPILAVNHWYMHRGDDALPSLVTEVHSDITRTRDGLPYDLADVLLALAQEFDETLGALKSCVDRVELGLQAGWPDLQGVREGMARAPAKIARGTESVRLLRELADSMRNTG